MLKINNIYRAECRDMNNFGNGVCFSSENGGDERVIFVGGAVTGDLLQVKITADKGRYLIGELTELTAPSPHRTAPACPVFGACGGCDFLHISREHELELKRRVVEAAFRSNGVAGIKVRDTVTAGETYRYRNKAVVRFGGGMSYGFYSERTHTVESCADCLLYPEQFGAAFAYSAELLRGRGLTPRDVSAMYIRSGTDKNMTLCFITARAGTVGADVAERLRERFPQLTGVLENVNISHNPLSFPRPPRVLSGDPHTVQRLCGIEYRIAPDAFFQVNIPVAEKIYRAAAEYVSGAERAHDLYSGAGTIALTVAAANPGTSVTGVEIVPSAVAAAEAAAAANGIKNAAFIRADAVEFIQKTSSSRSDGGDGKNTAVADALILDPPRGGCDKGLLEAAASSGAEKIVYVSCNPATLARDVRLLRESGYEAEEATPYDMFPRTGSVETVVGLRKSHAN